MRKRGGGGGGNAEEEGRSSRTRTREGGGGAATTVALSSASRLPTEAAKTPPPPPDGGGSEWRETEEVKSRSVLKLASPSKENRKKELRPHEAMVCGGSAGVVSQTVTYPIDTVRKRLQANTFLYRYRNQEVGFSGSGIHPTIAATIRRVYSERGLRGFYNGVSLNWIKGFLATGLAFSAHEYLKSV
eukprot:GHVU01087691.1.p1 GENE.GHVU01087691.1~~GHVU01087691.1.p1  ORF type:complete len:206 (-),score=43.99 GHVU01087691.1:814-1374(-)